MLGVNNLETPERLDELKTIRKQLEKASTLREKDRILSNLSQVKAFIQNLSWKSLLKELTLKQRFLLKSLIVMGQCPKDQTQSTIRDNLESLELVHDFFAPAHGLIGYQEMILKELSGSKKAPKQRFLEAPGLDISEPSLKIKEIILKGIEAQEKTAELWPVGGAGDRLGLIDSKTKEPLPAALLPFCGYNLLEGLVRDLFAREWLFFKCFGLQIITPVGLMTSLEKDNHKQMLKLFEGTSFFGRPKNSLRCFMQPLVPVVNVLGHWQWDAHRHLKMKPGGHGVMWKLALDNGIFSWFKAQKRSKVLVRQINNPLAATDYGLLAFLGYGLSQKKKFGFLSCQRAVGTAEGMNVLIEKKEDHHYSYAISNIEYTAFEQFGIKDSPQKPGCPYSIYPSNTNILFADIAAITKAIKKQPLPGPFLNFKSTSPGEPLLARLETMMQNISEAIETETPQKLSPPSLQKKLASFILYGERRKTISVTKNHLGARKDINETPIGALYDLFTNMHELLTEYCGFAIPSMPSKLEFCLKPTFAVILHPALGPLWNIISQKLRGGHLGHGSELILDIEAVSIENLSVNGSFALIAKHALGRPDKNGHIIFGEKRGKARLKNVKVSNSCRVRPLDEFLKRPLANRGLTIILEGFSEIDIEDSSFDLEEAIHVPDGCRLVIRGHKREVLPLKKPTWDWEYRQHKDTVTLHEHCFS